MVLHLFERLFGTFGDPKKSFWQNTTVSYLVKSSKSRNLKRYRLKVAFQRKKLKILNGSIPSKTEANFMVSSYKNIVNL